MKKKAENNHSISHEQIFHALEESLEFWNQRGLNLKIHVGIKED